MPLALRWVWTYVNGPAPLYAPAVAFNAFVALFPFLLGLVAVMFLLAPGRVVVVQVDRTIATAIPVGSRRELFQLLALIGRHARTVGAAAVVGMAWAGSALFSCLGGALNAIHGTTGRNVVRQRIRGLRLSVALVVAIALMVGLEDLSDALPPSPVIGGLAAALVLTLLFAFVYHSAPNAAVRLADALPGAVCAALLVVLVTVVFHRLVHLADSAATYGRGIALALALLTWLYFTSHAVLLGAQLNELRLSSSRPPAGA